MAKPESERVMASRKAAHEQVNFLMEKGGKAFLRAAAIREGVTVAEFIRRAVLARAGLAMLPYPDALKLADDVQGQKEAEEIIELYQENEAASEQAQAFLEIFGAEQPSAFYVVKTSAKDGSDLQPVLLHIAAALKEGERPAISGQHVGALRRLLANIRKI